MRGRKPQPLEVALRKNNPGRRPLNLRAPKHPTIEPAIPDELRDAAARAEWTRIVAALAKGHCTVVDRATLIGYCTLYAQWQRLEAQAANEEPILIATRAKVRMVNPVFPLAQKTYTLMLKTAGELGITPSSRTRIVAQPDETPAADEFSTYQRKRAGLA